MEKSLSVIALAVALSLAACQPKPVSVPETKIETIQQTTPVPSVDSTPVTPTKPSTTKKPSSTPTSTKPTKTPRLDSLEKRVKKLEDLARSYGAQL